MEFLKKVLERIKPSEEENKKIKELANKIIDIIKKHSPNNVVDVLFLGSSARNTNLKGSYDIDIFILFDKSTSIDELENIGLELGKKAIEMLNGRYEINYASHPYVRGYIDNYKIDIVPCYKIDFGEKIISAVDRTPLHHKFLINKLNENLCDEVRLLKAFLKSLGLYGSDVKTKGFSGYLCELLIIYYGSFLNLLKDAKNWKKKKVIILDDIYEMYGNVKLPEFNEPLVVYDPVDINRNVAAALSLENYCKFIFYSNQFLENPSEEFFNNYIKKVEENLNNREKGKEIILKIVREKLSDDIIYPQLEKLTKAINKIIENHEFRILRSKCWLDDEFCYIYWEFLVYELPNVKLREGPDIFKKERVKKFVNKYDKIFIKNCKVYAFTERKYKNIEELLNDIINKKIPLPKIKNIDISKGYIYGIK